MSYAKYRQGGTDDPTRRTLTPRCRGRALTFRDLCPGRRAPSRLHAHLPPSAVREHGCRCTAPVLGPLPPPGGAAHTQRARGDREGERTQHDPHRRSPRRARARRAHRRPGRPAPGDPLAHERGDHAAQGHPPQARRLDVGARRTPHARGAGRAAAGLGHPHPGGQRVSPTFSSLGVRNYRIYGTGAFISNIGTWMGRVAQDWLVLTELTHHSSSALGIVTGLQFLPFLLAPWTGMIADRY